MNLADKARTIAEIAKQNPDVDIEKLIQLSGLGDEKNSKNEAQSTPTTQLTVRKRSKRHAYTPEQDEIIMNAIKDSGGDIPERKKQQELASLIGVTQMAINSRCYKFIKEKYI